jgi:hypothetical protein
MDEDSSCSGFGIVTRNFEQFLGRNHVAGNEGPLDAQQQARGGGESYAARLNQLWLACQASRAAGQHLLMQLQGVEHTLRLWGRQLEQEAQAVLDCQRHGVPPPLPLPQPLPALPPSSLLQPALQRLVSALHPLRAVLEEMVLQPEELRHVDAAALDGVRAVLEPLRALAEMLVRIRPQWSAACEDMQVAEAGDVEEMASRTLAALAVAPAVCHALLEQVQRFQDFSQDYSQRTCLG